MFVCVDKKSYLAILIHRPTQALQKIRVMFTKVSWARRLCISDLQLKKIPRRDDLNLLAKLALRGSLL